MFFFVPGFVIDCRIAGTAAARFTDTKTEKMAFLYI